MWGNGRKYFDCIDLHCGGEPARIMFSTSCPPIPGKSMAEKRQNMINNFDYIRRVLLQVYNFLYNHDLYDIYVISIWQTTSFVNWWISFNYRNHEDIHAKTYTSFFPLRSLALTGGTLLLNKNVFILFFPDITPYVLQLLYWLV